MWLAEEYADIVGTQLSDASRWAELCSVESVSAPALRVVA